jgi:hypothetical protein
VFDGFFTKVFAGALVGLSFLCVGTVISMFIPPLIFVVLLGAALSPFLGPFMYADFYCVECPYCAASTNLHLKTKGQHCNSCHRVLVFHSLSS